MKTIFRDLGFYLFAAVLSAALTIPAFGANQSDTAIQSAVSRLLANKKEFHNVDAQVDDGIVTLTGNVDLYRQKSDAEHTVRTEANVKGVRNHIAIAGPTVSDNMLDAQLNRKLYYDRMGYDIAFNFVTASVESGVVTLNGETRDEFDHDSALAEVSNAPGVKDVIDNVRVAPVSQFDDQIRLSALRAIYRDPVLGRYSIDPAAPIRIVVDRGKLTLYGTVESTMDKQIAGIKAGQVFGAFSVQNNLEVAKKS